MRANACVILLLIINIDHQLDGIIGNLDKIKPMHQDGRSMHGLL
ncbi:hypothetical protein PAUR_a4403 [Pseudoalteromonas aurantia 208]|uniref:Uncharacterized protein n=1 Tax=Pseudoalteromonas aurantia 208 TaxID=1314867 RepID=A0ABR9EFQ7_9GAMM|nr:hypothetical protein [Pseudoalteromonas aurantia 208]